MQNGEDSKTPLERYLGATIGELRQRHGLAIAQISEQARINRGTLSKIENAQTYTGLDVLNRIANALGVSMSTLLRRLDVPEAGALFAKKSEDMEVVRQGTKRGHTYHLLAYDQGSKNCSNRS
jgi:transcriptional regulator with XRE-family HTH domain